MTELIDNQQSVRRQLRRIITADELPDDWSSDEREDPLGNRLRVLSRTPVPGMLVTIDKQPYAGFNGVYPAIDIEIDMGFPEITLVDENGVRHEMRTATFEPHLDDLGYQVTSINGEELDQRLALDIETSQLVHDLVTADF